MNDELLKHINETLKIKNPERSEESEVPYTDLGRKTRRRRYDRKSSRRNNHELDTSEIQDTSSDSNNLIQQFEEVTVQVRSVNGGHCADDIIVKRIREKWRLQKLNESLNSSTASSHMVSSDTASSDLVSSDTVSSDLVSSDTISSGIVEEEDIPYERMNASYASDKNEGKIENDTSDGFSKVEKKKKKKEKKLATLSKDLEYHKNNALLKGLCKQKMTRVELDLSNSTSSSTSSRLSLPKDSSTNNLASHEASGESKYFTVEKELPKNDKNVNLQNIVQSKEDEDFYLNPLQLPGYTDNCGIDYTIPRKGTHKIYTPRSLLMNLSDDFFTFTKQEDQ